MLTRECQLLISSQIVFEDRVIASILGKVVMLPSESRILRYLSIASTLQLHSMTERFPLSVVIVVLII